MIKRSKRNLVLFFLLPGFLFASLFIGFFHTEKSALSSRDCPACHFSASSIAEQSASPLPFLQLILFSILLPQNISLYGSIHFAGLPPRSPPQS
jgi:hypothetical protein